MTDHLFAQLKPAELDEMTEEAHRRRRSADLARAFQIPRSAHPPRTRFRIPFLLVAGTAAAGVAAAAVIVVAGSRTAPPAITPTATLPTAQTAIVAKPVDARSFLLAAAATAVREPATSGRYWYVRERTYQKVHVVPSEYMAAMEALIAEEKRKEKELKDKPDELAAQRKDITRKMVKLKTSELPYQAFTSDTQESWRAMKPGEANRFAGHQDVNVTFGSPQDEADWKAAGSPALVDKKPTTHDESSERILSIDNPSLTIQNISRLPTGQDAMKRRLDTLFKQSPNSARTGMTVYLWQTGVDLMTAPITPGTRSALFKVLAEQKGITSQGQVTDAVGRTGVALSTAGDDGVEFRMIINEETAELLQYEVVQKGQPLLRVALERMGWADRLGDLPA
ncbi:CU044_5270 family protein [Nonomuraea guangzhouensis]|uniref:CU044_5270 family protein n=1 Tax=Nonomuraea guangzhouensis TaxID=1291555 RepID=A0ABW4GPV0_9ACTN|nr:CU044_5270 family protein [Nonomuraea guangzhouensis]